MPYKSGKKKYRHPSYISCGKLVVSDAQKALKIAQQVKSLLNVEVKNHDVQQSLVNITSTPVIVQLTNIANGDTTNTRDGSQVKLTALEFTMQILLNSSATRSSFRCLIICDKQTNQALYTPGDVLEDVSGTDMIFSPINLDNKRRFQILADFTSHVGTAEGRIKHFKRYIKLNKIIRWDASTPSIADLTQSSLSLLMVSTEGTNGVTVTTFSRLRFVDN